MKRLSFFLWTFLTFPLSKSISYSDFSFTFLSIKCSFAFEIKSICDCNNLSNINENELNFDVINQITKIKKSKIIKQIKKLGKKNYWV